MIKTGVVLLKNALFGSKWGGLATFWPFFEQKMALFGTVLGPFGTGGTGRFQQSSKVVSGCLVGSPRLFYVTLGLT